MKHLYYILIIIIYYIIFIYFIILILYYIYIMILLCYQFYIKQRIGYEMRKDTLYERMMFEPLEFLIRVHVRVLVVQPDDVTD